MKILLAVDGSDYTKRMLAYLAAHEEFIAPDNQFSVLTAVAPVPPQVTRFVDRATLQSYYLDEAEAVLKPVRQFVAQQPWRVSFSHSVGHASEVIADAATDGKFELLVMGSHGRSALASLVLGSVTARVLARCKTPVLIVR